MHVIPARDDKISIAFIPQRERIFSFSEIRAAAVYVQQRVYVGFSIYQRTVFDSHA